MLAQRYELRLHLIGTLPAPQEDAAWRHYSPEELKHFRSQVIREAIAAGRAADDAWDPYKRNLEIDANLRRFAAHRAGGGLPLLRPGRPRGTPPAA